MVQRFFPLPNRFSGLALCLTLGALFSPLASRSAAAELPAAVERAIGASFAELVVLPNAQAAELWLAHAVPPGTALSDDAEFFADASEVFYDEEEALMVFVYRSAERGRWVAWVSFDPERAGVVHTAAIDL